VPCAKKPFKNNDSGFPYKYLPLELKYAIIKIIQFSGQKWEDPQTLKPDTFREHCQTLKE